MVVKYEVQTNTSSPYWRRDTPIEKKQKLLCTKNMKNGEMTDAATPAAGTMNGSHRPSSFTGDLFTPQPTSMTLVAALLLLEPPTTSVYLMSCAYLQNWLRWAYNQPVVPGEMDRVKQALQAAAEIHQLDLIVDEYADPGPIDNRDLSMPGYPLLLRPQVGQLQLPPSMGTRRRTNSIMSGSTNGHGNPAEGEGEEENIPISCCVVPERFYELLRSVHGVICEDDESLSFQPSRDNNGIIIHHHYTKPSPEELDETWRPRPIEFRRPIVIAPSDDDETVTKLLQTDSQQQQQLLVPTVEAFPIKMSYKVVGDLNGDEGQEGFLLVSRESLVVDVIPTVRKVVVPDKSVLRVRIWSKMESLQRSGRRGATAKGDGYELVHLDRLDGNMRNEEDDQDPELSSMTMGEWVSRHVCSADKLGSIDILVEIRASPTAQWARESLEFEQRLEVGDFCDAQDSAGKWYEAIVREITDDTIKVHYMGWASRWDGTVRRRYDGEVAQVASTICPPAPLWSHTPRWRERIELGQMMEIRESASRADRPKWYRGIVRKIGDEKETTYDMSKGAELELTEADDSTTNGNKRPLLVLNRTQQILVESPQENFNSVSTLSPKDAKREYTAQPPYIRWVSLYGEEICAMGTHHKMESTKFGPATLRYQFDQRRGPPVEIMKTFNNIHGAGFIRESLRGIPPSPGAVGLHNLGNSCFMNSIVQCLNHTQPLTQYFLRGTYVTEINRKNPLGSGGRVSTAYASLLNEIWSGEFSALAPRLLKQTVGSFAPQFNNVYQHDSHEFCSFLMDGIHEDLNRVVTKPYVEELEGFGMPDEKAAIQSWKNHLLRHDSIIVDHFQGMHRSHLTCPICGRESIKFDVYSSLSLHLGYEKGRSSIPLEECLEKFSEGEQLDEHNAWYCPTCKKHVCALKMIALWTVPDILILHLKRFTFDHCSTSGSVVRNKVEDKVIFPIERLNMRPYILGPIDEEAPPVYRLFGVSEHSGATANSGHYTATVRNSRDGSWYRYNDSHVGITSGEASVTGGAYVLFYQREKGTSRWGGMEKAMQNQGQPQVDAEGFMQVSKKKKKKSPKKGKL